MRKNILLKLICVLLALILVVQVSARAGDVGKAVASVAQAVVGVALVVIGVAGTIATANPAWLTLVDAGYNKLLKPLVEGNLPGGGGSPPIGSPSPLEPPQNRVEILRIELTEVYSDADKTIIKLKIKDIQSNRYIVPTDGNLWITHLNDFVSLVNGDARYASLSSLSTSGLIKIKSVPSVTVSNAISTIDYVLDDSVQMVNMKVLNSSGTVVYDYTESCPNPKSPIPFIWKQADMNGKKVPVGTYSVKLKAVKKDGSSEEAPLQVLSVGASILSGNEDKIYLDSNAEAYYTLYANGEKSDTVTVRLKDKNGDVVSSVPTATKIINFSGNATLPPTLNSNPLSFSSTFEALVDNIPVKIEIPGAKSLPKVIRVTFDKGSTDQIIYEYNPSTQKVGMSGSFGSKTYTAADSDVYYGILNAMKNIAAKVFKQVGMEYDFAQDKLSINESTLVQKSGVGSGYNVNVQNDVGTISINVTKGSENVISIYNLSNNSVSTPSDFEWAGGYEWDIASDSAIVAAGLPASGIKAAGISDDFKQGAQKLLGPAVAVLSYSLVLGASVQDFVIAGNPKYPMSRPTEPDIIDITWVNKGSGLIKIHGTAGTTNQNDIHLYINNKEANDFLVFYGSGFSVINSTSPLKQGENKINIIVRISDGREVESGDATVYLGGAGDPDLILVSPRDRQVFESDSIALSDETPIKNVLCNGEVSSGFNLNFSGNTVLINADGSFNALTDIKLKEGENSKNIIVSGTKNLTLTKTLIGAYKFTNIKNNTSVGYVLRRGDFLFSNKRVYDAGSVTIPFEKIPADPDHVGVYIGNGEVLDAVPGSLKKTSLSSANPDDNFYYSDLYYVTQIPRIAAEATRKQVVDKIRPYIGTQYDNPFLRGWNILGHYNGPTGGFYCSELAFWGWNQVFGSGMGINIEDTMYPYRGINDPSLNSILPAYFCEKTMKAKEVAK